MLLGLLPSLTASAVPTVTLRWSGTTGSGTTGSSAITVSNSQPETLTLEIVIDTHTAELNGLSLSLKYDTDGDDELDQIHRKELTWQNSKATRILGPINPYIASSQESSATLEGQIYGFEGISLASGPTNVSLVFARIVFVTKPGHIQNDGSDVISGFLRSNADMAFDASDSPAEDISSSFSFGSASVNTP
jgi:hypothetical protein